jgi:hypothetical protein
LVRLFGEGFRQEYWESLALVIPSFQDLGLRPTDSDLLVWETCQREELVLLTGNRNDEGPESLEAVIRTRGGLDSLPVFTIADLYRMRHDRTYAERIADRLLEYLVNIDKHRGTGRLYVP